jgi:hypothetical protein
VDWDVASQLAIAAVLIIAAYKAGRLSTRYKPLSDEEIQRSRWGE